MENPFQTITKVNGETIPNHYKSKWRNHSKPLQKEIEKPFQTITKVNGETIPNHYKSKWRNHSKPLQN